MKKFARIFMTALALIVLLPLSSVEACAAFIIGRNLTTDGSTLFGRTEDYPYYPNYGAQNKNYIVNPAMNYGATDVLYDEANGFTYPHLAHEYKYTSTPDAPRGDGSNGTFGAHGFNEHGVSMTATVTAIPNKKVLSVDPLVSDGLAESALVDLVLPRIKSAREGVELLAKVIEEKGSAEGNIVIIGDKNEVWYMEILSGHQYAAIKFPEDKYAVFANTYYLGNIDTTDTANVIASKGIEDVARQAGNYKTINGKFHIAKSYGPDNYAEGDRSRVYAGITLLDPQTTITYQDSVYDLLREPTDKTRKFSLEDAFNIQRNRFEHLPQFKSDEELGIQKQGDDGSKDAPASETHKYALGNRNVVDAHVYQIRHDLPATMGGVVWMALGQSHNAPYIPFYGNVTDTYQAFKPRTTTYDPNSWFWVAHNIAEMARQNKDLFGYDIVNKWREYEKGEIAHINQLNNAFSGLSDEAGLGLANTVTEDGLKRADHLFRYMKEVEAEMEAKLEQRNNGELVNAPNPKITVQDTNALTDAEKQEVIAAIRKVSLLPNESKDNGRFVNYGELYVADNGEVSVTRPNGTVVRTLAASDVVVSARNADESSSNSSTESEESTESKTNKTDVVAPTEKVTVANTEALTAAEKEAVMKAIMAANTLPEGTQISVADNGEVTITFADGTTKMIAASDVVMAQTTNDNTDGNSQTNGGITNSGNNQGGNTSNKSTRKINGILPVTGTASATILVLLGVILTLAASWHLFRNKKNAE